MSTSRVKAHKRPETKKLRSASFTKQKGEEDWYPRSRIKQINLSRRTWFECCCSW